MAYGEIKITGDEVLEALTYYSAATGYERLLNDEGERLADLIADRVMLRLQKALARKDENEG